LEAGDIFKNKISAQKNLRVTSLCSNEEEFKAGKVRATIFKD